MDAEKSSQPQNIPPYVAVYKTCFRFEACICGICVASINTTSQFELVDSPVYA